MIKPFYFSYINAKVRAEKSKLIEKKLLENLINSRSTGDIYNLLKNSEYGSYLKGSTIKHIHQALNSYFVFLVKNIVKSLNREEAAFTVLFFIERKKLPEKKTVYKKEQNFYYFIRKVDLDYIENIKKGLKKLSFSDKRQIKSIAGSYYDLYNLFTVVRLRIIYRLSVEEILPFIIPFGYRLKMEDFLNISSMDSISDISNYTNQVLNINFDDFVSLRKNMYRYHIDQIKKVWYGYPFRFCIPFAFLRLKEIEISNLKSIAEGVYYRLPAEEIEKMVVGI